MIFNSKTLLSLYIISFICILSCKNQPSHHTYLNRTELLQDSLYNYQISNEVNATIQYNDKKIETNNKSDVGLTYEIIKDSSTNYLLKITYDKLHVTLKDKEGEQEYDASNGANSSDRVEKLLGRLNGSSIYVTMDKKGSILNVTGTKEISDKLLSDMQAEDEYTKKTIREQISQLVGERFVKNNLEQTFRLFPDTGMRVGDSWTQKSIQASDIPLEAVSKYTLTDVKNDIAVIESESEVTSTNNGTTGKVMGLDVASNLKGSQTGTYKVDLKSGMLLSSESNTTLEGSIQVLGREVPLQIEMKREVQGKKIK